MTAFLLSLAGIPPLAGFIGKFYLFAAALDAGRAAAATGGNPHVFYALALAGVLNSVISVYYYMRISYHMFFQPPKPTLDGVAPAGLDVGPCLYGCLAVALAGILIFGIYPEPLIAQAKACAVHLP
jgi:NADH-quinone oxidoreductase subunit N